MKLFEQIRRAHERGGASIWELARRFGVRRRDVRAALASPVPPARKVPAVARPAPKLDEWKPLIDRWLAEGVDVPRKQRHTARRVWQRLVLEHGADVGESTVRRYVKKVKDARVTPLAEVAVVQEHSLGAEAEVDSGAVPSFTAESPYSAVGRRLAAFEPPGESRSGVEFPVDADLAAAFRPRTDPKMMFAGSVDLGLEEVSEFRHGRNL